MAVAGRHDFDKDDAREQISGAFIVDPAGYAPPDRVLMINIGAGRSIRPTSPTK